MGISTRHLRNMEKAPSKPINQVDELRPLYLAREGRWGGLFTLDDGTTPDTDLTGEVVIEARPDGTGLSLQHIEHLALRTEPVKALGGRLSLIGPSQPLDWKPGPEGVAWPFLVTFYYPLLTEKLGFACSQGDSLYPYLETMRAKLEWRLVAVEDGKPSFSLKLVLVEPVTTYLGKIRGFKFSIDRLAFRPLSEPPLDEKPHRSLSGCLPPLNPRGLHVQRRLNVHFYSLDYLLNRPVNPVTAADLEAIAQFQIDGACEMWCAKGGVAITPTSVVDVVVTPANYPNGEVASGQYPNLRTGLSASDPDRIEIYFVGQLIDDPSGGGGVTVSCGTNDAYIIMELDEARRNKYLLAHELGHVLGLRHPGPLALFQCMNYLAGSYCSLTVPGRPNSARNTANNLSVVGMAIQLANGQSGPYPLTSPVLEIPGGLVDWNADVEEHFFQAVRDFPYDDGTVASAPHPAPVVDWWTCSDVWNARQPLSAAYDDTDISTQFYEDGVTAVFGSDYSPIHQNPTTAPGQNNYMCMRLHAFEPLPSDVDVYLFLAVPGAATEPIRLVNNGQPLTFGGGKLPEPGRPRTQSVSWTVPSGLPAHVCVFAVAVTAGLPVPPQVAAILANPGNFNFYDLTTRVAAENDVAQRNMTIVPMAFGGPTPIVLTLPWFAFGNVLDQPAEARLEVDTTLAPELASALAKLRLEFQDGSTQSVSVGEAASIVLKKALAPGDSITLRLQADVTDNLPSGKRLKLGDDLPVRLRFWLDQQLVTGYTYLLRVSTPEEVALYTTEKVHDALRMAVRGTDAGAVGNLLIARSKRLVARAAQDPTRAVRSLRRFSTDLARDAQTLGQGHVTPERTALLGQISALAETLAATPGAASQPALLAQAAGLADRIQQSARAMARLSIK